MNGPADKSFLRARFRKLRREHVAALPASMNALLFLRPPAPVADLLPSGARVGLYRASAEEAPTLAWAKWLYENGRNLALPWFADRDAAMTFRAWDNPFGQGSLVPGPFGEQPPAEADEVVPEMLVVPLVAFTAEGQRLGQGGGHYDRWLAAHPGVRAIGLAWDCQLAPALPVEPHDRPLAAVVTPTRFYEGET